MSDNKKKEGISRRAALGGLGIIAAGCGGASGGEGETTPAGPEQQNPASTTPPTPPEGPKPPDPVPPSLSPKELLAGIDHVVVLMMENRSFDHFLGALQMDAAYAAKAQIEGLSGTETNPAPNGTPVAVFKMSNFTPEDPPHGWDACHAQFNEGKNDGFVKEHAGATQNEVMGYHDRSQIPLYYWFADNFTVCDNWFCSVMGATWPNRFYLHAATSGGRKGNADPMFGTPTIWSNLKAKGVSCRNYAAGLVHWMTGGLPFQHNDVKKPISEFFNAAQTGTLPQFSLIDPDYQANDDHPSHDIQRGQAFVASVYKALAESPKWLKTLLIITYDEHGGFFDHVPPPKVTDERADFEQLGFRVPAFVIGPTVKKGYVSKKQYEHVSVAATLRTRFDIADLNPRMTQTLDISDCIDPMKVAKPSVPPTGMPVVAMTKTAALTRGVGTSSQPALDDLVASGAVPAVNSPNHAERIGEWLVHAERLGAIRIVGK